MAYHQKSVRVSVKREHGEHGTNWLIATMLLLPIGLLFTFYSLPFRRPDRAGSRQRDALPDLERARDYMKHEKDRGPVAIGEEDATQRDPGWLIALTVLFTVGVGLLFAFYVRPF